MINSIKNYLHSHLVASTLAIFGFFSAIYTLFFSNTKNVSVSIFIVSIYILLIIISFLLTYIFNYSKDSNNDIKKMKFNIIKQANQPNTYIFRNMSSIKLNKDDIIKLYHIDPENVEYPIAFGAINYIQSNNNSIYHVKIIYTNQDLKNFISVYYSIILTSQDIEILTKFNTKDNL